jgi:hypothetical protein
MFFEDFETAQPLPLDGASACGLRQGAVNAGGSQVGIPGRGAFGRPIRFQTPGAAATRTSVVAATPGFFF